MDVLHALPYTVCGTPWWGWLIIVTQKSIAGTMSVFAVSKRKKPYGMWEPIFIGTNSDPPYDERLSWEGRRDKMTQGYQVRVCICVSPIYQIDFVSIFQLCVLDYDFAVLNNAFLIHKPGIKTPSENYRSRGASSRQISQQARARYHRKRTFFKFPALIKLYRTS